MAMVAIASRQALRLKDIDTSVWIRTQVKASSNPTVWCVCVCVYVSRLQSEHCICYANTNVLKTISPWPTQQLIRYRRVLDNRPPCSFVSLFSHITFQPGWDHHVQVQLAYTHRNGTFVHNKSEPSTWRRPGGRPTSTHSLSRNQAHTYTTIRESMRSVGFPYVVVAV